MSLRKVLFFLLIAVIIYNCEPDEIPSGLDVNFDHAAQALIDKDSIDLFLNSYFYDDSKETLEKLTGSETSLSDDNRLRSVDVSVEDVDYVLYYLMLREGDPQPVKENPTFMDSIFVVYRGERIVNNDSLFEFERIVTPAWFILNSTIEGWINAFPNFKGGRNVTTNGPIEYADGGKGVLIIPSGLAYRNLGSAGPTIASTIPANANLIFHFDLYDLVENTDHDNDFIPAIMEDPDGDGDPTNDDTDGNILPNYLDSDDDNDGILTRNEIEIKMYTEDTNGMPFTTIEQAKAFFANNAASDEILSKIILVNNGNYNIRTVILTNTNTSDDPDLPDYLDPTVAVSN